MIYRNLEGLTAPTAIVWVATAVEEAVESAVSLVVVALLDPVVVLVDVVCASVPAARALMPTNSDDRSMLYTSR